MRLSGRAALRSLALLLVGALLYHVYTRKTAGGPAVKARRKGAEPRALGQGGDASPIHAKAHTRANHPPAALCTRRIAHGAGAAAQGRQRRGPDRAAELLRPGGARRRARRHARRRAHVPLFVHGKHARDVGHRSSKGHVYGFGPLLAQVSDGAGHCGFCACRQSRRHVL